MLDRISKFILLILFTWLIISWLDILAHNSPIDGDYNYSNWNCLIMMEELIDG